MRYAKNRAARFISKAGDFPAVGLDILLDDRQSEAGALLVCCEIRLKDFLAVLR